MTLMDYLRNAKGKELVIGGHRGHQSNVRENTIANFQQLKGLRIPYVEIDVQLTKDQEIVIFHDPRLEMTTPLKGTVPDYSLEELRQAFEINTVDEVLQWARGAGMGIAFELKFYPHYAECDRKQIVRELARAIGQYGYYNDCFVFGKDYAALRYLRDLDKQVNIAIIAPNSFDEAIPLMREFGAFMYLDFLAGLDLEKVSCLHEAGFLVDGSVVDTQEELDLAKTLKVDMIESNRPEYLLPLLEIG